MYGMEDANVLNCGVEEAYEIKERLLELDDLKNRSARLAEETKQRTKQIDSRRKAEESEINSTISRRRTESTATLNATLTKAQDRLKAAKSDRDKAKKGLVANRIGEETKDLHEEVRARREDIKTIFQRNNLPMLFNNKYFFTLFFPEGIFDYLIIFATVVVTFALPVILFLLLTNPVERKTWVIVLIYVGLFAAVVGIAYGIIRKTRNLKNLPHYHDAKSLFQKIDDLKRRIKNAEDGIRKDTDESVYDLGEHDGKIKDIEAEIDKILEDKTKTLNDFESRIKVDITNEIHARYAEELDQEVLALDDAKKEKTEVDADLNRLTLDISKKYEVYLGKENLTVPMMDQFIEVINNGLANTIGEAIDYSKKQSPIT